MRLSDVVLVAIAAMGMLALAVTPASAAPITIFTGDFEYGNNGDSPPPHNTQIVDDWDQETGGIYIGNSSSHTPASDPGPCLYFGAGTALNQDLSYNWSASEKFTLGIRGQNPIWSGATTKFTVQLREADGTVLWDSGELDVTGTVNTGTKLYTGTGHIFRWSIDASTFGVIPGAVDGSQLNIRLVGVAGSPYLDDVTLSTSLADTNAPTLARSDIVDDKSKSDDEVNPGDQVTYTVTFSEAMDSDTVSADDFDNAGTATIVVGTITNRGGVAYSIPVAAKSTGTLELRIPAGTALSDLSGNPLDTGSAIIDDTTIKIVQPGDFMGIFND